MSEAKFERLNIIRLPEVCRRTGVTKPTIYRLMAAGNFPRAKKIGIRAVGWVESDIDKWIASRIAA
jgi:prophage regulatory protein